MSKISYIISTYKSEKFIDRRMHNLLHGQTDKDFEIIVIDSCSPENERDIVEKWQKLYPNMITYIRQENRTPYGVSWLEGFKIAKGKYCCNANTDDYAHPQFTNIVYQQCENHRANTPQMGFAYTGIVILNEDGQTINGGMKPAFDAIEYSKNCYGGPMLIWRNDEEFRDSLDWDFLFKRANQYRSAFDYTLALYFMHKGYSGLSIPYLLTYYTQRQDSIENAAPAVNNYESFCSIAEFFPNSLSDEGLAFKGFPNVPERTRWVNCRRTKTTWDESMGYETL